METLFVILINISKVPNKNIFRNFVLYFSKSIGIHIPSSASETKKELKIISIGSITRLKAIIIVL